MLRLEKGNRQNPIVISFRERPIVFSRELINAFGIALALHLSALILFHISPFKVRNPEIILPPSLVNIELPQSEGQVMTELLENEPRLRLPPAPQWTMPSLPEIPDSSSFIGNSLASMEPILKQPFQDISIPIPQMELKKTQNVRVNVSGPLADCSMDSLIVGTTGRMDRQCYAVKVEARKGTIFWFEQLEGSKEGKAHAEELLSVLKFRPKGNALVLSGEVEIIYD